MKLVSDRKTRTTYILRVFQPRTAMTCPFIASRAWKVRFFSAHNELRASGSYGECVNSQSSSMPPVRRRV